MKTGNLNKKRNPQGRFRGAGRRILAFSLGIGLMLQGLGGAGGGILAKESSGLCEHHKEHDASCGYVEAVEGQPCAHVHDENCGYKEAVAGAACGHVHNESCGYVEGDETKPCNHTHDETCGYQEAVEGQPCTHVHDENCGYKEAVEGHPCTFVCTICNGNTDGEDKGGEENKDDKDKEEGKDQDNVAAKIVTAWEWAGGAEALTWNQEKDSWILVYSAEAEEGQNASEIIAGLLPDKIKITLEEKIEEVSENTLEEEGALSEKQTEEAELSWDLSALPTEGPLEGTCKLRASLPEAYSFAQGVKGPEVVVMAGDDETDGIFVYDWKWVDEEEMLVWMEEENLWGLGLPGASEEEIVTAEILEEFLPAEAEVWLKENTDGAADGEGTGTDGTTGEDSGKETTNGEENGAADGNQDAAGENQSVDAQVADDAGAAEKTKEGTEIAGTEAEKTSEAEGTGADGASGKTDDPDSSDSNTEGKTTDTKSTSKESSGSAQSDPDDVLELTWDFSEFPEEGAWEGEYWITASLPEGYVLADGAPEMCVLVQLGGGSIYREYPGTRELIDGNRINEVLAEHVVPSIDPPSTTVNLFDYYVQDGHNGADPTQDDILDKEMGLYDGIGGGLGNRIGNVATPDKWNFGINAGKLLLFGESMIEAGFWNIGAGAGRPWGTANTNMKNIVENHLVNSWPMINLEAGADAIAVSSDTTSPGTHEVAFAPYAETKNPASLKSGIESGRNLSSTVFRNAGIEKQSDGTWSNTENASLRYLFDPTVEVTNGTNRYKESYENVKGLFQLNDDGYYYYYARQNFAEFVADPNEESAGYFQLYDGPAVWRTDGGYRETANDFEGARSLGNFFPFNKASQVFDSLEVRDDGTRILSSSPHSEVSTNNWSGGIDNSGSTLKTNNATGETFYLDHHMGMTVDIAFRQTPGGVVNAGVGGTKPMTFEFSGDDDVWVFIDDVLVLDIGGIHSELYGTINFATGDVDVGQSWRKNGEIPGPDDDKGTVYDHTTLRECFEKAGKASDTLWQGNTNTFASDTNHTIKMFYLERGNYDSSLALRFNLQPALYQRIKKVDQDGTPIEGVEFALYGYDKTNGAIIDEAAGPLGALTTGADGTAEFLERVGGTDGDPIYGPFNFFDRAVQQNITHYLLRETHAPAGYRELPQDIILSFDPNTRMLTVDNRWQTGAYASFTSTITGNSHITYGQFNTTTGNIEPDNAHAVTSTAQEQGLVVAIPFLYQEDTDKWEALYGSNTDGFNSVTPASRTAVDWRKAALTAVLYQCGDYADESDGNIPGWYLEWNDETNRLEGFLIDLPGRADRYQLNNASGDMRMGYAILDAKLLTKLGIGLILSSEDKYKAVGVYIQNKMKAEGKTLERVVEDILELATIENITDPDPAARDFSFLNVDQFARDFRSLIYIPNEIRELRVWKVDQDGKPVNGAVFGLYDAESDTLVKSGTTGHVGERDGVIIFTPQPPEGAADGYAEVKWANRANTNYYLQEISVPPGYDINKTKIPVVVGIYSIYADAGAADDGVTVMAGVGKLAQTMTKYASQGSVNISLRDITAVGQTQASGTFDLEGWQDMKLEDSSVSRSLNLHYGMNAMVDYGLHDEDGGQTLYPFFVTDTGFLRADVYQNYKALTTDQYGHEALNSANKEQINGSITSLFSLMNIVVVTDKTTEDTKTGELVISKKVIAGRNAVLTDEDRTRTFEITLELKDKDGKSLTGPYYFYGTDKSGYIGDGGVIYLHHDESITILGLPEGARYTVKETKVDGFTPTPEDGTFTGAIISDGTHRAEFINSKGDPAIGSIQIMKVVNSDEDADKDVEFEFTLTLGDTSINGTYGDLTFKDGIAKFKLKDGQVLKAYGLPMDITYEVVETENDQFSTVIVNGKGKIEAGKVVEVTFTNTRKEAEIPKIQIEKEQALNNGARTKNLLTAKPGDIVTYYITVTSVGNTTAKDVVVTDAVPSEPKGLTLVPNSISDSGTEKNGVITWQLGDMDPGQSKTVSFQVKVGEVTRYTKWRNVASTTFSNNPEGPDKEIPSNEVEVEEEPVNPPKKPENPKKPDKPGSPGTPDSPGKSRTTGSSSISISTSTPEAWKGMAASPKTGDDSKTGLWLLLSVIALGGIAGVYYYKKKKPGEGNNNEDTGSSV